MPKYVIERDIRDAGKLSAEDLRAAAQKSCAVLQKLGTDIQWVESYVTNDKVYCIYIAPNEQLLREHGKQGGFPVSRISQIRAMTDPVFAEA
jgi:cell division inhibitor SulA